MISEPRTSLAEGLQQLFGAGTLTALSEGQLLERFLARGDEAAFAALLRRHGPMVLGVCRRLLADPHDAEDAFQATFLVLVKKARSIRDRDLLGTWLYRVAHRVAVRARIDARRRRAREVGGAEEMAAEISRSGREESAELRAILEEEVGRLADRYRSPFVLCDLEGQTHEQAAAQLRCPVGTVKSRLSRARAQLRSRLDRRGLSPSAGLLAATLASEATSAMPAELLGSTLGAAMRFAAGQSIAAGSVSAAVVGLVNGTMRSMSMSTLKLVAAALTAALVVATGAGVFAYQAPGDRPAGDAGGSPTIGTVAEAGKKSSAKPVTDAAKAGPVLDARSRALLARLEEPIPMQFPDETPLEEVLKYIRSATAGPDGEGIPIYVDPVGLEMINQTMQSPIKMDLKGVPLRQTLKLVAGQLGMFYGIRDGLVTLTGADFMRQNWREYPVAEGTFPPTPPLQLLVEKAVRGEMTPAELEQLNEHLKAIEEATKRFQSIRMMSGNQAPPPAIPASPSP
jgi:RNA polymerase sigma factor (sigma-70 family)